MAAKRGQTVITKVPVPKISANVEEETVTDWFKKEGDRVKKGEPLLEITTDKVCIEVESPRSGVVRKILARTKSVLPVGYIVALIGDPDDVLPDVSKKNFALIEKHRDRISRKGKPVRKRKKTGKGKIVRATPAARRLAKKLNIDLDKLQKKTKAEIITRSMIENAKD